MACDLDSAGVLQLAATRSHGARADLAETGLVGGDQGVVGCCTDLVEELVDTDLEVGQVAEGSGGIP